MSEVVDFSTQSKYRVLRVRCGLASLILYIELTFVFLSREIKSECDA